MTSDSSSLLTPTSDHSDLPTSHHLTGVIDPTLYSTPPVGYILVACCNCHNERVCYVTFLRIDDANIRNAQNKRARSYYYYYDAAHIPSWYDTSNIIDMTHSRKA